MRTVTRRYRGMSVRPRAQMRVVPRKEVAFRPYGLLGMEGFFVARTTQLMEAIVMDPNVKQRNSFLYLSKISVSSFGNALFPLSVLQSYLLGIGLGYDDLALYTTLGTVVTSLVLFLLPGIADAVKQFSTFRLSFFGISMMLAATPLTLLLINLLAPDLPKDAVFLLLTAAHVLSSFFYSGFNATFEPKSVVRMGLSGSSVARLVSLVNLSSYIACVLSSFIVPVFTDTPERRPYVWLPALAVTFITIGSLIIFLYRPGADDAPTAGRKHISPLHVCRQILPLPQFRMLMIPNVLRAVGDSVRSFLTPIGLVLFVSHSTAVGLFTIANSIGGMLGSLLLVVLQKRMDLGKLYLLATTTIGAILVASCGIRYLPADLGLPLYALVVVVSSLGFMLYGSLPAVVTYKYVPSAVIGSFSALRLFVLNLFSSAFGYVIGVVLDLGDHLFLPLSIVALITYVASGVLFRSACRRMEAAKNA